MADAWKKVEIRHAKDFNALELGETATGGKIRRIGPTGRDLPDWVSTVLAGDSKLRDSLPEWLKEAVQQTEDNERRYRPTAERRALARKVQVQDAAKQLVPIVVLHEGGRPYSEDIVLMSANTFREMVIPILETWMFWHDPDKKP